MTVDEVFKILKEYYNLHKVFPSIEEFAEYSSLPKDIVSKIYRRWITQGKIIRKGNTFSFYEEDKTKLFSEEKKFEPDNMVIMTEKLVDNSKKEKVQKSKIEWLDISVRSLVGVIGVALVLCSIHFTYEFNKLSMKPFWAFCLSFSIVAFMSIAFTIVSFLKDKKLKGFVITLWVLGFLYSVFTAMSGQYNDFRKYVSSDKTSAIENRKVLIEKQLGDEEKRHTELLHWREQETEYSLNPDLKVSNRNTWITIQDGIKKLEENESRIRELQNQLIGITDVDVVSEETVYSWLCRILHISSEVLHLIIILFPSVFIDLCSGLCLMFTLSKKKDKEA